MFGRTAIRFGRGTSRQSQGEPMNTCADMLAAASDGAQHPITTPVAPLLAGLES